jgi:hypothetical protein
MYRPIALLIRHEKSMLNPKKIVLIFFKLAFFFTDDLVTKEVIFVEKVTIQV